VLNVALVGISSLCRESAVRDPLGTGSWSSLLQHTIDLLETQALGFWDQDICVNQAEKAERAPEEEDLRSEVNATSIGGGEVWSDDSDDLPDC
jgi:hypothetical protein